MLLSGACTISSSDLFSLSGLHSVRPSGSVSMTEEGESPQEISTLKDL